MFSNKRFFSRVPIPELVVQALAHPNQDFPSTAFERVFFVTIMLGENHHRRSKVFATSEAIFRLVGWSSEVSVGVAMWKQSVRVFQ